MRALGLDLGTKTLGVAITKTGLIANPLTTIRYNGTDFNPLLKEIDHLIKENNIEVLALGLPKNMNNSCGFAAERSQNFADLLKENFNIPVVMIDERLSTVEATNILLTNDMSRDKRKGIIDTVAAMLILDTYIKMKGNKNE